ncbi:hypothetical protein SDC9_183109 [bioreactor metagenome]|uniref:Uncharacterized protein n=1 Tax=bioreactor metagenome TaxID=1076179 RepID=A0A645H9C3_9ZZZZ
MDHDVPESIGLVSMENVANAPDVHPLAAEIDTPLIVVLFRKPAAVLKTYDPEIVGIVDVWSADVFPRIVDVGGHGQSGLFDVGETVDRLRFQLGLVKRRQKHSGKDGDDRDDNQELDHCEFRVADHVIFSSGNCLFPHNRSSSF